MKTCAWALASTSSVACCSNPAVWPKARISFDL